MCTFLSTLIVCENVSHTSNNIYCTGIPPWRRQCNYPVYTHQYINRLINIPVHTTCGQILVDRVVSHYSKQGSCHLWAVWLRPHCVAGTDPWPASWPRATFLSLLCNSCPCLQPWPSWPGTPQLEAQAPETQMSESSDTMIRWIHESILKVVQNS